MAFCYIFHSAFSFLAIPFTMKIFARLHLMWSIRWCTLYINFKLQSKRDKNSWEAQTLNKGMFCNPLCGTNVKSCDQRSFKRNKPLKYQIESYDHKLPHIETIFFSTKVFLNLRSRTLAGYSYLCTLSELIISCEEKDNISPKREKAISRYSRNSVSARPHNTWTETVCKFLKEYLFLLYLCLRKWLRKN